MKQLVISGVCKSDESVETLLRYLRLAGIRTLTSEEWLETGLVLTYDNASLILATVTPECRRMFTLMVVGEAVPKAHRIFSGSLGRSVFSNLRFNSV